jgi:hypothetical protein
MSISRRKRWFLSAFLFMVLLLGALAIAAEKFVEPALRKRLDVLVLQGSDSLYRYKIGKLDISLFGGRIEIDDLELWVDSTRYGQLLAQKKLPQLTLNIDMPHGHMRGVDVFNLLLGRKVRIGEIFTQDARIEISRNGPAVQSNEVKPPLWKMIRPGIKEIVLKTLRLEGVRFAYRYANDSTDMQVKFDTCSAIVRDVRIDSASASDPTRIGFAKAIKLHLYDLKFRSSDSAYKLKAKTIDYNSDNRLLSITGFKLQPTLKDKETFYENQALQREMTTIEFARLDLQQFKLEAFFHSNAIVADSLLVDSAQIGIYTDKRLPPTLEGKSGKYPQQILLRAAVDLHIKGIGLRNASLKYTERSEKTGQEGTLSLQSLDIYVSNVTNMTDVIAKDTNCHMRASGLIQGASPLQVEFNFPLNAPESRFTMMGTIRNTNAAQLNKLATPLAGITLSSLDLQELRFALAGDEYVARGSVYMRYRNLFMLLQKEDKETGLLSTKKFLTKLVNKYMIMHDNPGAGLPEYAALHVEQSRLMTQTFFGLIWNTIFSGIQIIITNTGEPVPSTSQP